MPTSHLGLLPLKLVTASPMKLVKEVLVHQRHFHQPKSTAKAVRQVNRLSQPTFGSSSKVRAAPEPKETPVRDALLNQLSNLVTPNPRKTSGVERQIRHTGQFATTQVQGAREQQKATLQDVSSNVSCAHI